MPNDIYSNALIVALQARNKNALAPTPPNPLMREYGYPIRQPYPSESDYFKNNPSVAGMAAADNQVTLNPYSKNSAQQQRLVAKNEAIRLWLRENNVSPDFKISPEQLSYFSTTDYGKPENIDHLRHTIIARALTGDPSVGKLTAEQQSWANMIKERLPKL